MLKLFEKTRFFVLLTILFLIGRVADCDEVQSRRLVDPSNRYVYLGSFEDCFAGPRFSEQIATRWLGEFLIDDVVVIDLTRVGRRTELVDSVVRDFNLHPSAGMVVRFCPRKAATALVDLNGDGKLDLIRSSEQGAETYVWSTEAGAWSRMPFPVVSGARGVVWGIVEPGGPVTILVRSLGINGAWQFVDDHWQPAHYLTQGLAVGGQRLLTVLGTHGTGVRMIDVDGDGRGEIVAAGKRRGVLFWNAAERQWNPAPFSVPDKVSFIDERGADAGLRVVDLDEDGDLDLVFSNERRYSVHLFDSQETGWQPLLRQTRPETDTVDSIAPIVAVGRSTGAWYDPSSQSVAFTTAGTSARSPVLRNALLQVRLRDASRAAVEGFSALVENDGDSDEWYNYRGEIVRNYHLRQTKRDARLEWETSNVGSHLPEDRVYFVFLGAMGYRSQPVTDGFALEVDGRQRLRFDITRDLTHWQSNEDGTSLLFYPTWTSDEDAAGFFYLTLPVESTNRGKSMRIGIRSLGKGSRRWFALHPVNDVVSKQIQISIDPTSTEP